MQTFEVKAWTTDWCGYESYYTVEAESEDEALEIAIQNLADEYDLIPCGDGQYCEMEDLDEDTLEVMDDVDTTTINSEIVTPD